MIEAEAVPRTVQQKARREVAPGDLPCQRIGREEYLALLISSERLERWDDPATHSRGLYSPGRGIRFLIDEAVLFAG